MAGLGPVVEAGLIQRMDRLRAYRVWGERERAVGGDVRALHKELLKLKRQRSGAEGAWDLVVPESLRGLAASVKFDRGVLKVRPTDAVARAELDRWLRSGGEVRVIRASAVAVRKVRLVV